VSVNLSDYYLEEIFPIIEENFTKKNQKEFLDLVAEYIDTNSDKLYTDIITQRLFFGSNKELEYQKKTPFKLTGLDRRTVENYVKKNKFVDNRWYLLTNNFPWVMFGIIRYFYVNNQQENAYKALMYLTLYFYSSLHYKFFPYEPNDNIMRYTVSEMSNKYDLKSEGNLFKMLNKKMEVFQTTYTELLVDADDESAKDYLMYWRDRLNSSLKNIANLYYSVSKEGKYINQEYESFEEEDYREIDNNSLLISKLSNNATMTIINEGVNREVTKISASISGISQKGLHEAIVKIIENENELIKELIQNSLQIFIADEGNKSDTVGSKKFILFGQKVLSKSNTKNESVIRIKEILDHWLSNYSDRYIKSSRAATLNNFRRGTYMYFIFETQQTFTGR